MTVRELIIELTKYPMNAPCYAYEGEVTGVVVLDPHSETWASLGVIKATEALIHVDEKGAPKTYMDKY